MSGWIKIEKSLETDPRVLRMARELGRRWQLSGDVSSCNALALPGVTLVCGALTRFWIFADSHIREDNTLDLGFEEIDAWLGIPNFCEMLPPDWIREVDENTVELPGFQEHNGVEAKKKALTQKRVEKHRYSVKRSSVTSALPDQDLDQDLDHKKKVPSEPVERRSTTRTDDGEVQRVFDHWREVHEHPQARLDEKRRKLIRTALKAYTEADLCQAIAGYKNSPHHMGQNDRATVYDAIELMLRDAKHIDAGLRFYREPPRTDLSSLTRKNVAALENWVPPEMRAAG